MKNIFMPAKGLLRPVRGALEQAAQRVRLAALRLKDPASIYDGDPFAQIALDPWSIRLALPERALSTDLTGVPLHLGRFHPYRSVGLISKDEWFSRVLPYAPEKELLYEALYHRLHGQTSWEDTAFFQKAIASVRKGVPAWNKCVSEDDLRYTAHQVDQLVRSIRSQGMVPNNDPVLVNIGPGGQIVKNGNGQHRIMIAMLLNIPVLVRVLVRCENSNATQSPVALGSVR
jgi:hypothetical protein